MSMTQDDKTRLKEFFATLKDIIIDIVEHPRPTIPGRHHVIIKAAWTELSGKIEGVPAQIDLQENEAKFDDHGLTGKQLAFKLALFWQAHDELLDQGRAKDGIGKVLAWWKRWFPAFKRTLATADVILDSMAQVVIPLGALKEFKKGVEACVQRSEEEYSEYPDTMIV
jgi:hypothetical protein